MNFGKDIRSINFVCVHYVFCNITELNELWKGLNMYLFCVCALFYHIIIHIQTKERRQIGGKCWNSLGLKIIVWWIMLKLWISYAIKRVNFKHYFFSLPEFSVNGEVVLTKNSPSIQPNSTNSIKNFINVGSSTYNINILQGTMKNDKEKNLTFSPSFSLFLSTCVPNFFPIGKSWG